LRGNIGGVMIDRGVVKKCLDFVRAAPLTFEHAEALEWTSGSMGGPRLGRIGAGGLHHL
jgi:hypothetical protein